MASSILCGAAIFVFALATTAAASADEIARASNAVAALDAVDAISTSVAQRNPRVYEATPVARPFVKTAAGTLLYFATSAAVTNGLARLIGRKSKPAARAFLALRAADELQAIARNASIIANPPALDPADIAARHRAPQDSPHAQK